ncbi:PilW family protein [Comamonas denitrificans]|uniref:PilW family protein n=1 Tax=Comamonas denitrificans TaxID=117506 RepID=A0A939GXQ9_9BURK|nr:PilW family protein [Comamonas denitrificans]
MALHTHRYIKKIATSAYPTRDKEQKHLKFQAGLTLIELMIGLAVGLLVVAVATVSLLGSRSVTGAVSDISGIQQQAAYVMRTFGTQLRQAGSLYLDLGLDADGDGEITSATAFQLRGSTDTAIAENNGSVTIRFTGYEEPTFANAGPISRNCLGAPGSIPAGTTTSIESIFTLNGTDLRCNDQPIAQNVAAFQVRYLLQGTDQDDPTMLYTNSAGVADWNRVQGVEVCLVLFGTERIDLPEGASYTGCDGSTAVNITTLAAPRTNRMHYVFRNVFQLRSQGLI